MAISKKRPSYDEAMSECDFTTEDGMHKAASLFFPELETLSQHAVLLLEKHKGKYVLIQGEHYNVFPNFDEAMVYGYSEYPNELFFVGRLDEQDVQDYLAVLTS